MEEQSMLISSTPLPFAFTLWMLLLFMFGLEEVVWLLLLLAPAGVTVSCDLRDGGMTASTLATFSF
uniref:Uncharacterized protein n=1 Tax=Anopheles minimus TaxID=112268 RepID=A0A182WJN9_9DIPT